MTGKAEVNRFYREFAAGITFFSFLDIDEFAPDDFKPERYREELDAIKKLRDITPKSLAAFISKYPLSIYLFSRLLRDQRFSNTQIAHFCFNLEIINSEETSKLIDVFNRHFSFDLSFKGKIQNELTSLMEEGIIGQDNPREIDDVEKIILLKEMVQLFSQDDGHLIELLRLEEFSDVSERTSNYLISNLRLEKYLSAVDVEGVLIAKRRPRDTKGLHGDFGQDQVAKALDHNKIPCIDLKLGKSKFISLSNIHPTLNSFGDKKCNLPQWTYASQVGIEGLVKPKEKKNKIFDFVMLRDGRPKIAIETNFYTTVGTKIGINIGEYTDLLEFIQEKQIPIQFLWITDGPTWLETSMRRQMVEQLIPKFGKQLMNFKQFNNMLKKFN